MSMYDSRREPISVYDFFVGMVILGLLNPHWENQEMEDREMVDRAFALADEMMEGRNRRMGI